MSTTPFKKSVLFTQYKIFDGLVLSQKNQNSKKSSGLFSKTVFVHENYAFFTFESRFKESLGKFVIKNSNFVQ